MSLLIIFLLAASPPPLSLEPFMDEEAAAHAFQRHIHCLASGAHDRRNEDSDARAVAAEIVYDCRTEAAALGAALLEVYRRKPSLRAPHEDAEKAAAAYVAGTHERIEGMIREGRKHK